MAVKKPKKHHFAYADHLWHGGDMIGLGVASYGYINGFHYQNKVALEDYVMTLARQELPVKRAYCLSEVERIVREFILQLKLGSVSAKYFEDKFQADVLEMFAEPLDNLKRRGFLVVNEYEDDRSIELTRAGLLCVDRLLPQFYQSEFKDVRYA
jgi:oxygen-independent coproporphyrinogen-3 oxidase